jgi:hypothetical protein
MKEILSIALGITVGAEFLAQPTRLDVPDNPHTHRENVEPGLAASEARCGHGGDSGIEPLGRFRWKVFYAEMLKANRKKQDPFAMHQALINTAHALVRDRTLRPWERTMQYHMLSHEAKFLEKRTRGRVRCLEALPAVAAALGITKPA